MSSTAQQQASKGRLAYPTAVSTEIAGISLHRSLPLFAHLYVFPFIFLYPLALYAYNVKYDEWIADQSNTFIFSVLLLGSHALSWLSTRWSTSWRATVTTSKANSVEAAEFVQITPHSHRGQPEIVQLHKTRSSNSQDLYWFSYQRDRYTYSPESNTFTRLAYACDSNPALAEFQSTSGLSTQDQIDKEVEDYGKNHFDIPVPTFRELFAEHAVAPFFVFQLFCVGLWCLDEYWYYSIFTLFMLVVFECTVVFQRLKTLNEFRTMTIKPFSIYVYRKKEWIEIQSDDLLPGDLVSITRTKEESGVPCDLLLLHGTAILNEAMLSGESTPLLKESIALLPPTDTLALTTLHRNSTLFGGTKVLQSSIGDTSVLPSHLKPAPDGGCLAVVLKTGFGTSQGQLIRTMIFSTERVSANNFESFLFIAFLLIFAIAASAYVWVKGVENDRKRTKLLLDCVIIITSVVPPELPMELSLAVNGSLVALSKYAIFCTEPFRIPFAGRVDICCFDKTGTITGEDLVVQGVAGLNKSDDLVDVKKAGNETMLTLGAAHALVLLDDGIVGDPMEKTTLDALGWKLSEGDIISPTPGNGPSLQIAIKRRYQFSSILKRMSTLSVITHPAQPNRRVFAAVKGAPETLRTMYKSVPSDYESCYKGWAQRGSRVLALGWKWCDNIEPSQINKTQRDQVECNLEFAGFLIFHCPLKPDAVSTLKDLNDSSHRCIMITGDNPLTAVKVARDVEIVDRETFILDLAEDAKSDKDLVWRTVNESKIIPVNVEEPIDPSILAEYDICMTGAALKQYAALPAWNDLVQHCFVYARVSPSQKEFILTTLKSLGYTTLMAGDGTNDVGALKQAHIGVALLDGSPEDLKKIAEHQRNERLKKVYESQLNIAKRFNAPPPAPPKLVAEAYPELVEAHRQVATAHAAGRAQNPQVPFNMDGIMSKFNDLEDDTEPPQIKLGDASVAAPFTSKLSNVVAIANIIRQGRCTLVATIQMYKILALNCLISAYSLSVMYLDGIKFGDYQVTITGMLMSVCFLCISKAKPIEKLSKERPLGNIFNFYILLSVLLQFSIHIVALLYMGALCESIDPRSEKVDLEAEFKPSLLNSAVYLISLSQQVSTFAVNYQGRPFRESISENPALYYGLVGVAAVAVNGATDFIPEVNRWLQLVDMDFSFRLKLTIVMVLDYGGAWLAEIIIKKLFSDQRPKEIVTRGLERREARRAAEAKESSELVPVTKESKKKV